MKKGILFFASAVVIGVGSAFTAVPKSASTPVYNTNPNGGTGNEIWMPITTTNGNGQCDDDTARHCKGLRDDQSQVVTVTQFGFYID